MYGQQSLMLLISAVTLGIGGGQLIEPALTVLVRATARGQAAAGAAARVTATAASTTVLASLAGGREAGRASMSRCGSLGSIIGFLSPADLPAGACRVRGGLAGIRGCRRMSHPPGDRVRAADRGGRRGRARVRERG
jgi:hypothetical protein